MSIRKTNSIITLIGWLGCMLLLSCGCDEQTSTKDTQNGFQTVKTYEKGPLKLTVQVDNSTINLAQTVSLRFETILPEDYELTLPDAEKIYDPDEFILLNRDDEPGKLLPEGNILRHSTFRLEPLKPGTLTIPELTFTFTGPDQKSYEQLSEPIKITATDILDAQEPDLNLAPIKDVVALPDNRPLYYGLSGVALLAVIITALILWHKRQQRIREQNRVFRPAHELAYARLKLLADEDLPSRGEIKLFYQKLSDILRFYIEHRFALRAPERTTEEFLDELRNSNRLSTENRQALEDFLRQCDLVKFAKHQPARPEIEQSQNLAEKFIDVTADVDCKIELNPAQQRQITQGRNW